MKRPIDASTGDAKQTPSKKQGWLKKLFSRSSRKTTKEPE